MGSGSVAAHARETDNLQSPHLNLLLSYAEVLTFTFVLSIISFENDVMAQAAHHLSSGRVGKGALNVELGRHAPRNGVRTIGH
jgi:hypothetical protein